MLLLSICLLPLAFSLNFVFILLGEIIIQTFVNSPDCVPTNSLFILTIVLSKSELIIVTLSKCFSIAPITSTTLTFNDDIEDKILINAYINGILSLITSDKIKFILFFVKS